MDVFSRAIVVAAALWMPMAPAWAASVDEARALLESGHPGAALEMLESLADDSGGRRLLWVTRAANQLDDWERGLEYAERLVERTPSSSDARLLHAVAIRNKMARVGRIRALASLGGYKRELARAIELDPKSADARQEEIGYLTNAPGIAGGDKRRAREKIEELRGVSAVHALEMEAALEYIEGNPRTAHEIWKRILDAEPDNDPVRLARAMARQNEERWADADADLQILLGRQPGSTYRLSALYQLGRSRVLGDFEPARAVDYFDRFIAERPTEAASELPSDADGWWRRGLALGQLDRSQEAAASYRRALREDSEHSQARKALAALE